MRHVLLVDDSPVMRRYVARTLEMIGMEITVHEAGNGKDAMSKAFEIRPDLIITDLNMPEMSGGELLAAVGRTAELRGTPMIVMSADRSAERPDQMILAGAMAYLTKPVTPESLRRCLVSILEEKG